MNNFEKKIELLMVIKKHGENGVLQDEILKELDFFTQSNLSMTIDVLFKIGYVSKEKTRRLGEGQFGCSVKYRLTDKAKSIFG